MKVNRGKDFEAIVKTAFEAVPNTVVYRIPDQQNYKIGSKNPCDFLVYRRPLLFAIECKVTTKATLPFTNITDFQWEHLLKMSQISGVAAGILCWYIEYDRTRFIPIQLLESLKQNGAKSIRYDYESIIITDIKGNKKRVFWEYDMTSLFQSILC